MDASAQTTSTNTLSESPEVLSNSHFRQYSRSSQLGQADRLTKHVLFHDDDILWDRFLVPFSSNPPDRDGPSGDPELIHKVVGALRTTCLSDLDEIQVIQAEQCWNENRMMTPLENVFCTIEQETVKHCKTRAYFRAFVRKDYTPSPIIDPPFCGDSPAVVEPGFFLADFPPCAERGVLVDSSHRRGHVHRRQCIAFVEVKATSNDLPIPPPPPPHLRSNSESEEEDYDYQDSDAWKRTLVQAADHARLLMARRPSLLSAYALFVCGNTFCVALCDRAGMVVSPAKRLSPVAGAIADLECFVRVVLRFTWDMSPVELGEDPTTVLAAGYTLYKEEYPRYDISTGFTGPGLETTRTQWTTVGEPLWVSHGSLLGRGTAVWLVLDQQTPLVLKSSWRVLGWRSETELNDILRSFLQNSGIDQPKGLSLASAGGDVHDGNSWNLMSVANRRGSLEEKHKLSVDRVLHRVCFTRFGKPIWQYSSLEEFARAMRDALQAHEFLSGYGILHGDISAGNILIDIDASYKAATATEPEGIVLKDRDPQNASGFLSDWELAWFPRDVLDVATSLCGADPHPVEPDSGDMPIGTPIFLATEVLLGLSDNRKVVRNGVHELESFEWVILYAVYKHSIESATSKGTEAQKAKVPKLMKEFQNIFVDADPPALANNRILLLAWPTHPSADLFLKIKELVSFVKDVVGSEELLVLLMDVWQDLTLRMSQLRYSFRTPVRPGSHFQNRKQPPPPQFSCMKHQDLIRCLEKLVLAPGDRNTKYTACPVDSGSLSKRARHPGIRFQLTVEFVA